MSIEEQLVAEIKPYINKGWAKGTMVRILFRNRFFEIAWDYVFQKVYLHAALKKQKIICEWFDTVFTEFEPIQQIALRQMFSYARHLLNK